MPLRDLAREGRRSRPASPETGLQPARALIGVGPERDRNAGRRCRRRDSFALGRVAAGASSSPPFLRCLYGAPRGVARHACCEVGMKTNRPVRSTAAFPAHQGRLLSACTPANKTATASTPSSVRRISAMTPIATATGDLEMATGHDLSATYFRNRLNSQYDGGDAFDDRTIQASTAARRIPMAARAFFVGVRGRL
jgi:hypothetical protein